MKQIRTDDLSFDGIKDNLKTFLRGQSQFDAYDFEGSAMSVLLDILAANTHMNLLYTNMAINEGFIDSASKRESVISLAKSLGYTAKSARSAVAKASIVVTTPQLEAPSFLTIPKGTIFSTNVGDSTYTFSTLTDYSTPRVSGVYTFPEVYITEGNELTRTFTVAFDTQFVIPNLNVDTTTISVDVTSSGTGSASAKYNLMEDLLTTRGADKVFFLKQRDDLYYEIFFGNGAIGKEVANGSTVRMKYHVTSGAAANGANVFTYQSGWRNDVGVEFTTLQSAFNGSAEEDIDSIRFNAPRTWVSQNRALTASDYENILLSKYSNIESINVWGGQDNEPKVYGKVFICAKPYNAEIFSTTEKQNMIDSMLIRRGVVSVTPEFVDASYMNIELTATVNYNATTSRRSSGELQSLVKSVIEDYGSKLNKFDSVFRYSKLSTLIDSVDSSISGNSMTMKIRLSEIPYYNLVHKYIRKLNNPVSNNVAGGNIYSTRFYISEFADRCYVRDNGSGRLFLITEDVEGTPSTRYDVGSINYTDGSWVIDSLNIQSLHDTIFEFVMIPAANDIVSNRNIIVKIDSSLISVSVVSDQIVSGAAVGGANYKFTTVR